YGDRRPTSTCNLPPIPRGCHNGHPPPPQANFPPSQARQPTPTPPPPNPPSPSSTSPYHPLPDQPTQSSPKPTSKAPKLPTPICSQPPKPTASPSLPCPRPPAPSAPPSKHAPASKKPAPNRSVRSTQGCYQTATQSAARSPALSTPVAAPKAVTTPTPHRINLNSNVMSKNACTADALLTVAGLQHLVANHKHILSETVYRSFEVPLLHELDKWRGAVEDEEESYASAVAVQSKEINRLEKEGLKLHRQKRRDVNMFRNHLVELTTKLDGLTFLHGEHARTLLRESQETSARIVEASCSLVRAEVDIFESLARKGWTGGGLEEV
ncbi:uncharacterized protein PODANS_1_19510, partial [Podospora anserina S mat+]